MDAQATIQDVSQCVQRELVAYPDIFISCVLDVQIHSISELGRQQTLEIYNNVYNDFSMRVTNEFPNVQIRAVPEYPQVLLLRSTVKVEWTSEMISEIKLRIESISSQISEWTTSQLSGIKVIVQPNVK
jgi:hypothetical protein